MKSEDIKKIRFARMTEEFPGAVFKKNTIKPSDI